MELDDDEVIERLLRNAEENNVYDAVVVYVPSEVIDRHGGAVPGDNQHGWRIDSNLFAGAVEEETLSHITLDSPSRVGSKDDFSEDIRNRLRPDGVYGFRDGALDGVKLVKEEVRIYRVD